MSLNFAIIELKSLKKLFDIIPAVWIYYFEKNTSKKNNKSVVCFWPKKAPLKIVKCVNAEKSFVKYMFTAYMVHQILIM